MNEYIVYNWNGIVKPDDTIYVLGDLCLGGSGETMLEKNKELIESLNGNLHIVKGNHDTDSRIKMYYSCKNVIDVNPAFYKKIEGYTCFLAHFPCITSNLEKETLKQCVLNFFGHTHSKDKFYQDIPFMYNVACDAHFCTPVSFEEAIHDMKMKRLECIEVI